MTPVWVGAALAGLMGSPHCAGMCGGFAVASSTSPQEGAAWHLGRLATYAVLGGSAGVFGASLGGPPWVLSVVTVVLLVWFAARLAGITPGFLPHIRLPKAIHAALGRRGLTARFGFGVATGLLPCGLVYAALGLSVSTASAWGGALAMVFFGLGTVPMLAAVAAGLQRVATRRPAVRKLLAASVLAAGLWSVALRTAPAADGPACHEPEAASGHVELAVVPPGP